MDPTQISSLAKLLRDNGDKVLNANFKLTLSGPLLRALNDSFSLIADQNEIFAPQTFQVVKTNNSKSEVFRDLQFIHDFVQKTRKLCVTEFRNDEPFTGNIEISKFRNLSLLEINRVSIHKIIGIQQMRAHLQEITCNRSVECVQDIISHCGGDKSNGFVWTELKTADFSFNTLKTIDCSLEFTPYLQHLNLSHNHITSVDAVKWLPHLKILNLGFNRLTHIPMFHKDSTKRLKILVLTNNFIEDLSGISRLDALTELDLSGNCLIDHSSLLPISTLISLHYLNLEENPLACHPKHRQLTSRYLHKNTSSVKFILDSESMTKAEKTLTGNYQSYHSILTSKVAMNSYGSSKRPSGQSTPSSIKLSRDCNVTPASSVGSIKSYRFDESKSSNISTDDMSTSIVSQKKVKARRAIIADDNNTTIPSKSIETKSTLLVEGNKEHLETKKQIEDIRKHFGDNWLQNEGAHMVQNVIGIQGDTEEKTETEQLLIKTLREDTTNVDKYSQLESKSKASNNNIQTSTPVQQANKDCQSTESPINHKGTIKSDENIDTANNSTLVEDSTTISIYTSAKMEQSDESAAPLDDVAAIVCVPAQQEELILSDPEDNEFTYIVTIEPSTVEMLLIVSDRSIKEKDAMTGRTKTKWSLKSLESCDRIKSNVLRLNFDTIKKDKKERIYNIEQGYGQQLELYFREILSKRPLSEMNQTVYRCANCALQFSRENICFKDIYCPECKSSYVIEIKESPKAHPPTMERVGQYLQQNQSQFVESAAVAKKHHHNIVETSESQSSIGSATSLNESSSCSKISKSGSSFDSNQSVAGSSAQDRQSELSSNRNGESDVEVISNPSQSSIGVLDSVASSRKHSEERRMSQLPSLDRLSDDYMQILANQVNQQTSTGDLLYVENGAHYDNGKENEKKTVLTNAHLLTESSSSGSVTDSICTAYEQNQQMEENSKLNELTLTPNNTIKSSSAPRSALSTPEKNSKNDTSVISSMFGGLFQSTNLLMSRSQKSQSGSPSHQMDEFKFSYKNFDRVDHRLKLYAYQKIFEDNDEQFKWLVKGKIIYENIQPTETTKSIDGKGAIFDGFFIMSTTKFYIYQISGEKCDDPGKWTKRQLSGTVDRIEMVRVLPWKIGVSFTVRGMGSLHLVLQDILRTDSLLLFFSTNPLPTSCTLEYQISERLSAKLLKITENAQLKMLSILNGCETSTTDDLINKRGMVGMIVTETLLYLVSSPQLWINEKNDVDIESYQVQFMSNLVEVEKLSNISFRINFLDENQDKCEIWTCSFETDSNAESTLNTIGLSWEKLFGVPLTYNDN